MLNRTKNKGFSLVELAVVLAVLGILFVGAMQGVASFKQVDSASKNAQSLLHVKQQIFQFGKTHKYLPCPDTDNDGYENRTASTVALGSVEACKAESGTVPYLDLGLRDEEVEDLWGNRYLYVVNSNADNASLICDKTQSASMFCNFATGVSWFNLQDTPPLANNRGAGNYYICDQGVADCNALTVANDENVLMDSAVFVLAAFNQDGDSAWNSCGSLAENSRENCDMDEFFQFSRYVEEDGQFYDDQILGVSGYEVKSQLLSSVVTWNSFEAVATSSPLTPTYEDFDINAEDNLNDVATSGDDVIMVNRNVSQSLSLGAGNDYIVIGNDLEANSGLATNGGNDSVYIVGNMFSTVNLGGGDDLFVLAGDLANTLRARGGNDLIWIQGGVKESSNLELNNGDDILWLGLADSAGSGGIDATVRGGSGYDILILETESQWLDLTSAERNRVNSFDLVIFKEGSHPSGSGRAHCFLNGSTPSC